MAIIHKIKARLYKNLLPENSTDYIARVVSEKSLSVKDICETATLRGGSDIKAPAMEHAVNLWLEEMAYNLYDGFSVNTGWFTVHAAIKGAFKHLNETYNSENQSIGFDFRQGSLLRKGLNTVEVDIIGEGKVSFFIAHVLDVRTGSENDNLTPGRNLKILGRKIKIEGESDANGVYFVNQETQERIKVPDYDLTYNLPSEVTIVIPDMPSGCYKLEITTQFTGNPKNPLKEPRSTIFEQVLTIV